MDTEGGFARFLVALLCVIVGGFAFGVAGFFLAGFIGDAVNPNFGYEGEGMDWLPVGAIAGAVLGALLGLWLALRLTSGRK